MPPGTRASTTPASSPSDVRRRHSPRTTSHWATGDGPTGYRQAFELPAPLQEHVHGRDAALPTIEPRRPGVEEFCVHLWTDGEHLPEIVEHGVADTGTQNHPVSRSIQRNPRRVSTQ